jgi:hypothetical protein
MAIGLTRLGLDAASDRMLFLLEADSMEEVPPIVLGSKYFVSLVVCDASLQCAQKITELALTLLKAGCVYFCCWGPECERVHDTIDQTYLELAGYSPHTLK